MIGNVDFGIQLRDGSRHKFRIDEGEIFALTELFTHKPDLSELRLKVMTRVRNDVSLLSFSFWLMYYSLYSNANTRRITSIYVLKNFKAFSLFPRECLRW